MANKSLGNHNKHHNEHDFKEQLLEQPYIHTVIEWCIKNLKLLGIAAGAIVLLIVAIYSWSAYQKAQNEKAIVLEGKALKAHQEISENIASQAADEKNAEPEEPYKEVVAIYQEILNKYSGTESAERSLYLLGSIAYEDGSYDQAQDYFSRYVSKYPQGLLVNSAKESLGYVLEQQQSYQKAIDAFKELEKNLAGSQKTNIQLAIARNYEALEKDDEALAIYQEIVDSSTTATLKQHAKERLDLIQARQKMAANPVPTPVPSEKKAEPAASEATEATPVEEPIAEPITEPTAEPTAEPTTEPTTTE